jgi:hypothetical protein
MGHTWKKELQIRLWLIQQALHIVYREAQFNCLTNNCAHVTEIDQLYLIEFIRL